MIASFREGCLYTALCINVENIAASRFHLGLWLAGTVLHLPIGYMFHTLFRLESPNQNIEIIGTYLMECCRTRGREEGVLVC